MRYAVEFRVRYKVWRSNKDKQLHLLCGEGADAINALPAAIRHLGPWTGGAEGDAQRLRLPYRSMLTEQGFAVIYAPDAQLQLEATGVRVVTANEDCPTCKGKGRVPMHHGLRTRNARGAVAAVGSSRSAGRFQCTIQKVSSSSRRGGVGDLVALHFFTYRTDRGHASTATLGAAAQQRSHREKHHESRSHRFAHVDVRSRAMAQDHHHGHSPYVF